MEREVRVRQSVEVAAAIETVYGFRLDCMNLPSLNPAVSNVRRVDGGTGKPGTGTSYTCDVDLEWGKVHATVDIERAEDPSLIVLDMETRPRPGEPGAPLKSREVATFTEVPGGRTRVDVELTMYAPPDMPEADFAAMEQHAGTPVAVELAAMKTALEP